MNTDALSGTVRPGGRFVFLGRGSARASVGSGRIQELH